MRYQLSASGPEFSITCENKADIEALIHILNQSLYEGEPEIMAELQFELNAARSEFVMIGTQPSLFDAEKIAATAPVGIDNKMPPPSGDASPGWMGDNAEFQAGLEAGWRGDIVVSAKSDRFHEGYEVGAAQREKKQ